MIDVIKKDGNRQAFNEQKVRKSIENAAREARVPVHRLGRVVDEASRGPIEMAKGKSPVETRIIRERILTRLDTIEPAISIAWRTFDRRRASAAGESARARYRAAWSPTGGMFRSISPGRDRRSLQPECLD